MGVLDPPSIPLGGSRQVVKWSNVGTRCVGIGQPATVTLNAASESYNLMAALEAPFDAVRLVFTNSLPDAKTVGPVKVAAVATAGNPHATGATYVPVTFDGSYAGIIPGGSSALPSFMTSDWVDVASVARTDGGLFPLLSVFALLPVANGTYAMTGGMAAWGTSGKSLDYSGMGVTAARRYWNWYKQNGDYVTNPASWPSTFAIQDYGPVAMIQFRVRTGRIITILGQGDSIMQGAYAAFGVGAGNDTTQPNQYATPHCTTAGLLASTPALPVTVVNAGISGQTHLEYGARLARMLDIVNPDIVLYPPFSPNSAPPVTNGPAMIKQTSTVLTTCQERGVTPILLTSIPVSYYGATDDGGRNTVNNFTRSVRGVLIADHDAVITDGASPAKIQDGYRAWISGAPDSTHPNGLGHYQMAVRTAAAIATALASGLASPAVPTPPAQAVLDARYAPRPSTQALSILHAAIAMRNSAAVIEAYTGSSTTAGNNATSLDMAYFGRIRTNRIAAHPIDSAPAAPVLRTLAQATAALPLAALGFHIVTAGVGGTTAVDYLTDTTAQQVLNLKPNHIGHMVGSNDLHNGVSLGVFGTNLANRLDWMHARELVPTCHSLIASYERFDVGVPVAEWWQYVQVMADIAAARPGWIAFTDISPNYQLLLVPGLDPFALMDTDKVHQKNPGHLLMGDLITEATRPRPLISPVGRPPLTVLPTVIPVISGDPSTGVGAALTATTGTWTNAPAGTTTTYTYQWKRAGVNIAGATASAYTLVSADLAVAITVTVMAARPGYVGGSATSAAVNSSTVTALANTVAPVVSGTATTGSTLTTTNGTWSGSPTSYTYVWTRDGANIAGATATTYALVAADEGKAITAKVTAVKSGTASVTAAASNYVTGAAAADPLALFTSDGFATDTANLIGRTSDASSGGTAKAWTGPGGGGASFQSLGGALKPGASTASQFVGFTMGGNDQAISVKMVALSDAAIFLSVRRTTPGVNDAFRVQLIAGTGTLQRTNGGVATNLTASPNFNFVAGDRVEVRAVGSTISCSVNGVVQITTTDATLAQAGYAGVSTTGTAAGYQLDDVIVRGT